jgi:thiamine kinase-like enzyme
MWRLHECDRSALIEASAALPITLVHGDFFPPNIGLRKRRGDNTLVLIDWEWTGRGCGALDVAKLLTEGAALSHPTFDREGLSAHYFDRYLCHGGSHFDSSDWWHAFEIAEIYHAVSEHPLSVGYSLLHDSSSLPIRQKQTPRLAELIRRHLG